MPLPPFDSGPPSDAVSRDWTEFESPSYAAIRAVAAATGTRPDAMGPLNDVVDPDGLDALLSGRPSSGSDGDVRVRFRFEGCDVVIADDGRTVASPVETPEESTG